MRKLLITILITLLCVPVFAQSAASIRKNNSYIYTEATAATSTAADSVALDALVGKLAQTVDLPYSLEIRKSLINTYLRDIKKGMRDDFVKRAGKGFRDAVYSKKGCGSDF